jgi:FkbM family methyltransferase
MKKNVLSFASFTARVLPMPLKRAIYRFPPLAKLVRRELNRAAPQGLAPVRVAAGNLAGVELELDLQVEKDYWLGTYEPELQQAVEELVSPGMVAYDIGANIGYITLMLARRAGENGQVYAFEALPENVERLKANLRRNHLETQVRVFSGAVVEASRPVQFQVGPSGGMGKAVGSAGRQEVHYRAEITVPGLSLDEFVYGQGNPPPDAIKMDIEGGEVLAVRGMSRVLNEARPILLVELHGPESASVVWNALLKAGYRICRMQAGFPAVRGLEQLDWKAYIAGLPLT